MSSSSDEDAVVVPENHELIQTAKNDDLDACKTLLEQWKQQLSPCPITPAHLGPALGRAISSKHARIVAYLLSQGAVITGNDMILALGETDAAIAMFQTFLDHGWDINSKTDLGNVMLKHIISNPPLVAWFLTHGASATNDAPPGSTLLDVAAANSTPAVIDLLIAHGALLSSSDALHTAAGQLQARPGRDDMLAHLLDL
ncbi:MAG: hypothetical protein Q9163_002992, partial [Psora crenata]